MPYTLFLVIGALAGVVAGMLGVGGGTVIVPALLLGAGLLGIDPDRAPAVAVATSLAVVVPTSLFSARAHARRGAVDWRAFGRLAPGISAGAMAGAGLAGWLGGPLLVSTFIVVALLACGQMLRQAPASGAVVPSDRTALMLPRGDLHSAARAGPLWCKGAANAFVCGVLIGLVSALAGVGGGLLSVPLLAHNLPLKRAIGTAAALGLPLASAGLAGYVLASHVAHSAGAALGEVLLPAAFALSLAAVLTAPLGAYLAHRLPVQRLKRIYAVWLLLVCVELGLRLLQS
jgi:uncharacterized membrane protein YfcA